VLGLMALLVALAPGSREAHVALGLCAGGDGDAACEEARSAPDPGLLLRAGAGSAPSPDEVAPRPPVAPDEPDPGSSGLAAVPEIEEEPHEDPVVPVLSVYTERQLVVSALARRSPRSGLRRPKALDPDIRPRPPRASARA
jgi:hypothetical protein